MGFWFLDDRAQLALLMAGLVSAGAAGCGSNPAPLPSDMRVERRRDFQVSDPVPPDLRLEVNVSDMLPPDARVDQRKRDQGLRDQARREALVVDCVPPDMRRVDQPQVVDMVPVDASASWGPRPQPQATPRPGRALPLERVLRARIGVVARGNQLELTARDEGQGRTYRWKVSGGSLDRSDGRTVRWTPPPTRGRHLAQLTVRDGSRAVSIDVYLHEVQ
jgi:hypothetical protein